MPPRAERRRYLPLVKAMGFDAVEVGVDESADVGTARELLREVEEYGLAIGCVRAGGGLCHPLSGLRALEKLKQSVQYAAWTGASIVNTALVNPPTNPGGPGVGRQGETVSQGASRTATEAEYVLTAERLREAGRMAADLGVTISIEVHQGSIADNSTATLHLLDLVGLSSVGANPDLGNIYWQYEEPEETSEQAILALSPRAVYWHCKNLSRVHIPDLHRSFFHRVPLPDGEIDYRFAISAMLEAGYDGFLAVEGAQKGDQLTQDRKSLEYVQGLLAELSGGAVNGTVRAIPV